MPTIKAVGVARPIAQGHATTNIVMKLNKAISDLLKTKNQTIKLKIEAEMTIGTKMLEILSTFF
jgi:hypothetical protein